MHTHKLNANSLPAKPHQSGHFAPQNTFPPLQIKGKLYLPDIKESCVCLTDYKTTTGQGNQPHDHSRNKQHFKISTKPRSLPPGSHQAALVAEMVKNLPAMQETRVRPLGQEDPLEKEMATHSDILAWRIPWTEEPGGLQSMGWQRVGMTERLTQIQITLPCQCQAFKVRC